MCRSRGTRSPKPRASWADFLRDVMKLNADPTFRVFGPDETDSNRLNALFEVTDKMFTGALRSDRRAYFARRPRDGSAQRAYVPGLARRLSAHRPARLLFLLRSVHPHRRFDVQPARQMAEGHAPDSLAAPHRLAQLPADFARLAAGSQRLHPPGSRVHRSRGEQESRRRARLSAAGCEHAALGGRSLPAQPATTST